METQETNEETIETKETETQETETKEYSDNEKQLFARAKNAEKELKELKLKLKEGEKKPEPPVRQEPPKEEKLDAIKIAKLANSLKEYDDDELGYIELMSKAKGCTLEDTVKDEDVKLYISAKRDKKQKDNMATTPNGKQPGYSKEDPFVKKFSQNLPKGFDYTK